MYLIFAFDNYYPFGGMDDYKGSAEDINEAIELIREHLKTNDEAQLVQIIDRKLVEIGQVSYASFIDAIGVNGWLRELQKLDKCHNIKDIRCK